MYFEIRPMQISDLSEVVKAWNISMPYDRITDERFQHVILDDPNHETGAALVAVYKDNIIGFISSIARDGVSGADGRGREHEKRQGYIRGIFVIKDYRKQGIGTSLLEKGTDYMKSKGKSLIRVITYTGRYFFPGVDLRYEEAISFFRNKGFKEDEVIDDLILDLEDFQESSYQKNARKRMAEFGVKVVEYDPDMLDKMRDFVRKFNSLSWFPPGWEENFRGKGNKVAALKDDKIVGWASYHPSKGMGGFGPIGVLEDMRGHGIGSCLLLESVLKLKQAGVDSVFAGWANTPFYIPNGWRIHRQYAVFEKIV
ncbi:GNAT family N-acetyltransferase [Candidatus Poribacteria bacterium]|nr:GNAT family N-acetyltransferase [Candidatus Poribacteria bacterium]